MTPLDRFRAFTRRLAEWNDPALFISLASEAQLAPVFERLQRLEALGPERLPLHGLLFAVKDNIDWEPLPTTVGCPAFAYRPERSATVVERLIAAGAIPVGKTNLDQFATGLVGTRSPYGTPRNAVAPELIPGGSSSGSASAVAAGLVDFALGTDTAGSGRVPAAFQNLVGYKPTRGLVSTRGVFPACRTLDCVSVFARTTALARAVGGIMAGFDPEDPFSQARGPTRTALPDRPVLGIPLPAQRVFADAGYGEAYAQALHAWRERGAELVELDLSPLLEAAQLLYGGPWVAERLAAVGAFWKASADALHPVTRQVLATGEALTAQQGFEALHRLESLRREAAALWSRCDLLVLPTTPTVPTLAQALSDPLGVNSLLGTWTNFLNLLDAAALALPGPACADGRPFGQSLVGPAGSDALLFEAGALGERAPGERASSRRAPRGGSTLLAVAGAHLRGLPLNPQLVERGARFVAEVHSAAAYRLYTFTDGSIRKPGMVRAAEGGIRVPLELWDLPEAAWGSFMALIPHPLGLGRVELEDGAWVTGFLMEASAIPRCVDITQHGGWKAYLEALAGPARR
jgi:allophanate hydrolase